MMHLSLSRDRQVQQPEVSTEAVPNKTGAGQLSADDTTIQPPKCAGVVTPN